MTKTQFGVDYFENKTFETAGLSYSASVGLFVPNSYYVYAGAPFLTGNVRGLSSNELGNPFIGGEVRLFNIEQAEVWVNGLAKFSRPGAEIAAHHDTYRPGGEIRFTSGRFFGSMGGGYSIRDNEEDQRVDVGDVVDAEFMLGRKIFQRWAIFGKLTWYRAYGVRMGDVVFARTSEWAGFAPGVRYRLFGGVDLINSITFPILQTQSTQETEVALWDIGYPRVSEITWNTELGVQF